MTMFHFATIVLSCKDAAKLQQPSTMIVGASVPVDVLVISRQYNRSLGSSSDPTSDPVSYQPSIMCLFKLQLYVMPFSAGDHHSSEHRY